MMNELIERLSKQAMEYAAEQYGPQRAGELVWDPYTYDKKFAELVANDCIEQCERIAEDALQTANGQFVTETGRVIHQGMWGGAKGCADTIRHRFGLNDGDKEETSSS